MSASITSAEEFTAAPKGTLVRITTANGLRATAVKLGNGSLLEVKRAGVAKKQPYASLDAWRESFDSADPILSLTLDGSASAARSRLTPLLPATEDVKTMRTIDESIRYSYRYRVEYWSTYDKLRAEADRVLADPTTSESVRAYLTKWCAKELNRILQWGRGVKLPLNFRGTHWLGRGHVTTHSKMYVKNFEKDSFIPIEYYTVTSPYSQRIQHILARALEFPVEEVIKFRGKFGTTFAELGVPRGPDGAPEFWVVSGLDGTMTKYKPAAA